MLDIKLFNLEYSSFLLLKLQSTIGKCLNVRFKSSFYESVVVWFSSSYIINIYVPNLLNQKDNNAYSIFVENR